MSDLAAAASSVVTRCLGIRDGENLLVVADPGTLDVGRALLDAGLDAGADAVLLTLPPRPERGTEPPPAVAAALSACDAYLAPCLPSLSHTTARKAATDAGIRGATLPGVTADLLGRLMGVDVEEMATRSRAVARALTDAEEATLTCPHGTEMTFDLRGRTAIADDGDLTAPAAFGNLPCGEGFISPAGGSGTLVVHSIAIVGLPAEPVRLDVRDGALTGASGPDGARFLELLDAHGPDGRHLAELAAGTNPAAGLTGNVLEDEKALGTAHVAFGASAAIGGTVSVPVHLDVVVLDPTLVAGGVTIVRDGTLVA
jgi:leucyl aminopeptidase (aminopeptidase T)